MGLSGSLGTDVATFHGISLYTHLLSNHCHEVPECPISSSGV